MKANELRIGNWVMGTKPFEIEGGDIALASIREKTVKAIYWKPITLTEEWLIKFGFEKITGWDDYEAYIKDGVELEYNTVVPFRNYLDIEVKYVHQLQNLYFALTGDELTSKKR